MELSTDQKGAIAEAAIAARALELGVGVSKPIGDERYDLIFDLRPGLVRVQCKWAGRHGDTIGIRCYRCRRNADGLVKRGYDDTEVDAYAAYYAPARRCFFLPLSRFGARLEIRLRLAPTLNNQKLGVHWADDYEFERLDWAALGAVAQLGERRAGSA